MATVAEPRTRITAREFLEMDLGEGRYELVRGEVVMCPPPEIRHGRVCANTTFYLEEYGRRTGHGHSSSNDSRVDIDEYNLRGDPVADLMMARTMEYVR